MKRVLQAALIASAMALLSACASSGGMASAPVPAGPYQRGEQIVRDAEYVAAVEHVARERGIHVQWVNPPRKRIPAELSASR